MKYLILILVSALTACSNSDDVSQNIKALNGTWVGSCYSKFTDDMVSNDYVITTYSFNNGNYEDGLTFYSDKECTNVAEETKKEIGVVTFIEEMQTQSGLTASKLQYEVISSYLNRPPTYESLIYLDGNNLYFGAFIDDLNVIFLDFPYMKDTNN